MVLYLYAERRAAAPDLFIGFFAAELKDSERQIRRMKKITDGGAFGPLIESLILDDPCFMLSESVNAN